MRISATETGIPCAIERMIASKVPAISLNYRRTDQLSPDRFAH
jgi:hypothetical protein